MNNKKKLKIARWFYYGGIVSIIPATLFIYYDFHLHWNIPEFVFAFISFMQCNAILSGCMCEIYIKQTIKEVKQC